MFFILLCFGFVCALFLGFALAMVISVLLLRKSNDVGSDKGKLQDYTKDFPLTILEKNDNRNLW